MLQCKVTECNCRACASQGCCEAVEAGRIQALSSIICAKHLENGSVRLRKVHSDDVVINRTKRGTACSVDIETDLAEDDLLSSNQRELYIEATAICALDIA